MAVGRNALEEEMSRFERELKQETRGNPYPQGYGFRPQNPNYAQYQAFPMVPPRNIANSSNVAVPPPMPPTVPPPVKQSSASIVTPEQQRQWESQYQVGNSKPVIPAALASSSSASTGRQENPTNDTKGAKSKDKKILRMAGGQVWEDTTLSTWDTNDFRLFCGDLGNEVTEELLTRIFSRYSSLQNVKVVRDKRSNKSKGYGFLSFKDSKDYLRAMKEMNGKYVGNRPIKLRKSTWKDRNIENVKRKEREKKRLGFR